MIVALNSPRWREFQQAYGSAGEIPALLAKLPTAAAADGESEPWHSLWSSLCHQGTVYTASYAAVPHISSAAALRSSNERLDFLVLIARIVEGRYRADAAAMPDDLAADFEKAVNESAGFAIECLNSQWSANDYRYLVASIAALQSQEPLGRLLFAFDDTYECPNCEKRLTETLI